VAKRAAPSATSGRLPTKDEILDFLQSAPDKVGKREIARAFKIKGDDRRALKALLSEMTAEGLLLGNRREIRKPGSLPPVGVIEIIGLDTDGELIAEPVVWNTDEGPRPKVLVPIQPKRGGGGGGEDQRPPGIGDRVLARLNPLEHYDPSDARFVAEVIKRLPREKRRLLGIFNAHGSGGGTIKPVDRKALKDWPVQKGDEGEAEDGDLVRFDIARSGRAGIPQARILESLGNPEDERKISLIAVHAHGIPEDFPEGVLAELDSLTKPDLSKRTDLRDLPLLTIDPPDARDHDDAVHAEPVPEGEAAGGWIVTVAIADVAHYVRPGSRLDGEAQKRGNSVYFPDRVVPMLPEKISNDTCSLKENEERACLAVRMVFDRSGAKLRHTFHRAVMRSRAKLSYQQAQAAFDGQPDPTAAALWEPALKPLLDAYHVLAKARDKRGPLNLDLPERKIILDEKGHVERIVVPERLEAHRLIEEFMIQANVAAAESLEQKRSPLIYRTHDQPSRERLKSLNEFLESLGLRLPRDGTLRPDAFNRILEHAKELPVNELVNEVILRAQAQAEYAPENYGHFGLNLRRYAHFTSPIRRYADLLVHRALIRALKLGNDGLSDEEMANLGAISEHISQTERRAMAAERETVDRLIAAHLADRVGAEFHGRISGVTKSGLFVRLADTGADGFIPASTLGDDYYHYVEEQHALVGDRSGLAYRLGDRVDVRLAEAIPMAGALRFEMLSKGQKGHVSLQKGWRGRVRSPRRHGGRPRRR
jgi:ribonuclease R